MHVKIHEALTVSTAVDGSPVLPPPDPLSCHPPLGRLDAAGAAQLSGGEKGSFDFTTNSHTPFRHESGPWCWVKRVLSL